MAFKMHGAVDLPATPQAVWEGLNDPTVLRASIPGCEELDKRSDTDFAALVGVKIGPVSAKFRGTVQLKDLSPPFGCRIEGQGDGGAVGVARGGAVISLDENGRGGTTLRYDVDAVIGGKLLQFGGRVINGVAKKLADEFFANFANQFTHQQ
jgi:carbon monoxide dehydrogenase subunit G